MEFASDIIEERYIFGHEERKAALKRSGGICACCGKKLTTKTMTMDHIIPISRGGTNEAENLIALCEDCNKEKGNILYMPVGYYIAMENQSELKNMERYVEKWFLKVKEQFDIERFPLIAPMTNVQLSLKGLKSNKKHVYLPQAIFRWQIINRDYYEEIEAVTGIDIREIRRELPKIHSFTNVVPEEGYLPTVALYSFRKMTTDKIIAVVAVQLLTEQKHMNIWIPWCEAAGKWQGSLLYNFVAIALSTIERIAGYEIAHYTVIGSTKYNYVVRDFAQLAMNTLGKEFLYKKTDMEYLCIVKKDNNLENTLNSISNDFSEIQKQS